MADSKPYMYCHHCGNRYSNESLKDHEHQCRSNDGRKVLDSFDFKTKKQEAKTRPVEDNDRVKEMKETPETTLEEKLKKETGGKSAEKNSGKIPPSPQEQLLNETELLKENEKDKFVSSEGSTKYSSDDLSEGGTRVKRATPKKVAKEKHSNAKDSTKKISASSSKKEDSITTGKKSDQLKDNKAIQNTRKEKDDSKPEPSPRYSSRSCDCSEKLLSKVKNTKNDNISQKPKPIKKTEHTASETDNPAKKSTEKVASSNPKKIDPITGKKKSYQSQDKGNQDNKAFPNPRKVSEDSNLLPSPRYSSRSCECAEKYSSKKLNNTEVEGKDTSKVKSTQNVKPFPIMNKFDKTPDKQKVDSKELAKKREELEKDNEESTEDIFTKIDKQFICKYCGQNLAAEDIPTHERLCERRPYKEHELKVERKLL